MKVGKPLTPALFTDEEGVVMIEYAQRERWTLPTFMPRPPCQYQKSQKVSQHYVEHAFGPSKKSHEDYCGVPILKKHTKSDIWENIYEIRVVSRYFPSKNS
jgi:hypothetical protein